MVNWTAAFFVLAIFFMALLACPLPSDVTLVCKVLFVVFSLLAILTFIFGEPDHL